MAVRGFRFASFVGCLALAGLVAACSGGADDDDDIATTNTPVCTPIADTLSALQTAMFTPNCALASCHSGAVPAGPGLDLSAGMTHGETVGVTAVQLFNNASVQLVNTAGGANASYIYLKISNANGIQGLRMPQTGGALCQEKLDSLAAWIAAGAPDN